MRFLGETAAAEAGIDAEALAASLNRLRKNSIHRWKTTTRAEARTDSALRGAQAPLFHGAAHIFEFFRNL